MKQYYVKTYRPLLQNVIDKCEEEFERKSTNIAAGSLGVSFGFIHNIVTISAGRCLWILLSGWTLLLASICINCFSYLWSKKYAHDTIVDIDNEYTKSSFNANLLYLKICSRNKKTMVINLVTIWSMIVGLLLVLIYVIVNLVVRQS